MKKVNFSVELLGLDKQVVLDESGNFIKLNNLLANALVKNESKDSIGMLKLAEKVYEATGEIDIEEADFSIIETSLPQLRFTVLVEAQLLKIIKKAKEQKEPEKE